MRVPSSAPPITNYARPYTASQASSISIVIRILRYSGTLQCTISVPGEILDPLIVIILLLVTFNLIYLIDLHHRYLNELRRDPHPEPAVCLNCALFCSTHHQLNVVHARFTGEIDHQSEDPPSHNPTSQNAEQASWTPIQKERFYSPEY